MILVWSSEGGPLQYIGLCLFLIQFIVPTLLNNGINIPINLPNGNVGFGGLPLLWFILTVTIGMMMFVGWLFWDSGEEHVEEGENASAAPEGTVANPVDVDAQPEVDNTTINNRQSVGIWGSIRLFTQNLSPQHLILASAFILPLSIAIPILINSGGAGFMGSSSGTIAVTVLAIAAHLCMAIAAYGILREVLAGTAPYPGMRRGARPRRRKFTVAEIADIVRKIPVEEFVSENDIKNGDCSIARMKRILVNRSAADAAEKCLEKEDLINEICRVRKYNEECAICSEDYAEG
jgi:hypothetical protein